jgi:GAF domain-containing protein
MGVTATPNPSCVPNPEEKRLLYAEAFERVSLAVGGERDAVARMATTVAVLHGMMPHFHWTGFHRVVGGDLVVGPYQGTPACLRIALGRGVCGVAWESGETQVVADVGRFPGHIACDARSASEIVVPLRGTLGEVAGVLDVDSCIPGAFDSLDRRGLERIVGAVFG